MNYVEPIKDTEKLRDICEHLKKTNMRNYIMFSMGIYTGLRVSDILKLRVRDVHNRDIVYIKEKKTGKRKETQINTLLKKELKTYCDGKDGSEYLIKSQRGHNDHIKRNEAYKIVKDVCGMFGIEKTGTHTMRKTFGYHYYKKTGDIVTLQKLFNHSHISVTLRYIGIDQEETNKTLKNFRYY